MPDEEYTQVEVEGETEVETEGNGGVSRKRKYNFNLSYKDKSIYVVDRDTSEKFQFQVPMGTSTSEELNFYLLTQGYIKVVSANLAGKGTADGARFLEGLKELAQTPVEEVNKKFIENKTVPKPKGWTCILNDLELKAFALLLLKHGHITQESEATGETAYHMLKSEALSKDTQEKIKRNKEFIRIYLELLPEDESESLF